MRQEKVEKEKKSYRVRVPVLPLRDVIVFPHMVVPLFVGREKSINALEQAVSQKIDLLFVVQRQAATINPSLKDIYQVGTLGSILQILRLPDNTVKVLIEGKKRAQIVKFFESADCLEAEVEIFLESAVNTVEREALVRSIKSTFENYVRLNKRLAPEVLMTVSNIEDPGQLVDVVVAHLNLKLEDKQGLLETRAALERLRRLLELLQGEIEIFQVEKRIRSRVKKQMERSQKEYYLNEQMQAIQRELGEKDDFKSDIAAIEKQLRGKNLTKEVKEKVQKELKKLKLMSPMSAEAIVVRNYLDWILSLPWNEYTSDSNELGSAKKVLENDHYGLEDVKERILEYLAVRLLTTHSKGQILCFAGPPGVGKTSLARSIAAALNKKFVRCSLGGVRDEAEIRGHRRTYVGALPGKVIQALKKAGSSNPVFLFDEVDKMSTDFRGDPSSALLEVLDPEQNNAFSDHYLEVDYDLSKVMFILTANSIHSIARPLLDRMEVIFIAGYTEQEKFQIVRRYLLEKQKHLNGLKDENLILTDGAINALIRNYTKEAGVRNLERMVAMLCRKGARKLVENFIDEPLTEEKRILIGKKVLTIHEKDLEDWIGPPKYLSNHTELKDEIGLVNGLAYTEVGGDLLQIEVTVLPGKGQIKITGKLGEVMQESAATAVSYARSRADLLGLEKDFYQHIDLHLHVPEGAVPKDGPSAGITMATAIISALIRVPVKRTISMTGEITLRGRVLPIGGLKEKLLAAKAAAIFDVIIPQKNFSDFKKLSQEVREGLRVHAVEHMDEVLRLALVLEDPMSFLKPTTAISIVDLPKDSESTKALHPVKH